MVRVCSRAGRLAVVPGYPVFVAPSFISPGLLTTLHDRVPAIGAWCGNSTSGAGCGSRSGKGGYVLIWQFGNDGAGDPGTVEVVHLQLHQPHQVHQSQVGDLAVVEVERLQAGRLLGIVQSGIRGHGETSRACLYLFRGASANRGWQLFAPVRNRFVDLAC